MPSSPKVQKETILQTAYEMLLRDGYGGINIKTIANELGCSTQPISRQFGSMEGFRRELLFYCLDRMKTFFRPEGENAAVGFIAESKENVMNKVQRVSEALLRNWREPKGE